MERQHSSKVFYVGSSPIRRTTYYFYRNVQMLRPGRCSGLQLRTFPGRQVQFLRVRFYKNNGRIAQLVEQRIENPCVTGSTPVMATKN